MLEIPCTLRCDECKETQSVILAAAAQYTSHASQGTKATFTIEEDTLPPGWSMTAGLRYKLRCPRCSGVK